MPGVLVFQTATSNSLRFLYQISGSGTSLATLTQEQLIAACGAPLSPIKKRLMGIADDAKWIAAFKPAFEPGIDLVAILTNEVGSTVIPSLQFLGAPRRLEVQTPEDGVTRALLDLRYQPRR